MLGIQALGYGKLEQVLFFSMLKEVASLPKNLLGKEV